MYSLDAVFISLGGRSYILGVGACSTTPVWRPTDSWNLRTARKRPKIVTGTRSSLNRGSSLGIQESLLPPHLIRSSSESWYSSTASQYTRKHSKGAHGKDHKVCNHHFQHVQEHKVIVLYFVRNIHPIPIVRNRGPDQGDVDSQRHGTDRHQKSNVGP